MEAGFKKLEQHCLECRVHRVACTSGVVRAFLSCVRAWVWMNPSIVATPWCCVGAGTGGTAGVGLRSARKAENANKVESAWG